jgi:hypothetical protein
LGLIGIQLEVLLMLNYGETKDLGKKFYKNVGAIGSQSKKRVLVSTLIGHPLYGLS